MLFGIFLVIFYYLLCCSAGLGKKCVTTLQPYTGNSENSEMSKELVVDQAVNTLRRGMPFVQNGMQYTLDTIDSLLECGTVKFCFINFQ